ncbi:MAG: hypothetical protein AAF666_07520 [Pseudomonadota bacterium]
MGYEYKCVGAPERAKRRRGAKSRSDRVAKAVEEVIAAEAVDGWEYQRTDLIPMEEKAGFLSRPQEVHRAVLVFRRALASQPPSVHIPAAVAPVAAPAPVVEPVTREPEPALQPEAEEREEPIRLAAENDEVPTPAPRVTIGSARKAPSGLG